MAHDIVNGSALPINNGAADIASNAVKMYDGDMAAIIDMLRKLRSAIRWGAGAPAHTLTIGSPGLYMRTDGTSVTNIYFNPGGVTWSAITTA